MSQQLTKERIKAIGSWVVSRIKDGGPASKSNLYEEFGQAAEQIGEPKISFWQFSKAFLKLANTKKIEADGAGRQTTWNVRAKKHVAAVPDEGLVQHIMERCSTTQVDESLVQQFTLLIIDSQNIGCSEIAFKAAVARLKALVQ